MLFSQHTNFLFILLTLICLITTGLGYFNKQKLDTAKHTLVSTKINLGTSQNALEQLRQNEAATQKQLSQITAKLEQVSATLVETQENLKKASTQITELNSQITTKDLQITGLSDQTNAQAIKIKELSSPLRANAQAKHEAELTAQIVEQKALVSKLQSQVESAQNKIQEYVKKDLERQKMQARLGLEGKVLAVNQAWNFVVLSIGNKSGVTSNAEMLLKRGNQYIGKVRITSVEPSTSIADVVNLSKGQLVQPGDSVIYEMTSEH